MDAVPFRQIAVTLRQLQLQMHLAMGISFALFLVDRVGSIVMRAVFFYRSRPLGQYRPFVGILAQWPVPGGNRSFRGDFLGANS